MEKTCRACHTAKPTADFDRDKRAKDGLASWCKPCQREATRRSRAKDPEAQRRKRQAELERNRERSRKQHAEWYTRNREKMLTLVREWRRANPEQAKAIKQRRLQRLEAGFVEHVDRDLLYERDEGRCGICKQQTDPEDWTIDHIVPLSANGTHEYANVQVAHAACNSRKGTRTDYVAA